MRQFLEFSGPVAQRVLMPSDPKLAMDLAAALLEPPRMINLSNGLWGYTGSTDGDAELTVQSSGLGGPSAAIVAQELHRNGMRRAVRIGRCRALATGLEAGQVIVVEAALRTDGASAAPGEERSLESAPELLEDLARALPGSRRCVTAGTDLPHQPTPARQSWVEQGAAVADLASGALLAVADRLGFEAAAALVVDEDASGNALGAVAASEAVLDLGRRAATALMAKPPSRE